MVLSGLAFIFVISTQLTVCKISQRLLFEPQTSGVGSDNSTN